MLQDQQSFDQLISSINAQESARLRDEAVARVGASAPPLWVARARQALVRVAALQHHLTTDDVWLELEHQDVARPPEPRAMGAIMTWGREEGHIVPTNGYITTKQKKRHASPVRVWESKIWGLQ